MVHIEKGKSSGRRTLDGAPVDRITAFLFHRGGHADPVRLAANAGKSFQGSIVLGMGFTFDDTDRKGVASPLAEMRRLIETDPRNREVIFPYIGGQEVNTSPTHAHHRYVINFGERSEAECRRRWPDLMAIVEERVKPERMKVNRQVRRDRWWQFGDRQPALHAAITDLERILVISRIGDSFAFTILPNKMICNEKIVVFPFHRLAPFCVLQSRIHEIWARFFSSTLGDALQYTPSDCFDTFPFPEGWETDPALEAAGKAYYEYRAALMVDNDEGMTSTYNRFHDLYETDPRIAQLRDLHAAMDRAVLDAYGWTDIPTDCDLLLDYEIDEASWGRKKKPYRWRWPDEVRDEVLARLLALNADRAAAEARAGIAAGPPVPRRSRPVDAGDILGNSF